MGLADDRHGLAHALIIVLQETLDLLRTGFAGVESAPQVLYAGTIAACAGVGGYWSRIRVVVITVAVAVLIVTFAVAPGVIHGDQQMLEFLGFGE